MSVPLSERYNKNIRIYHPAYLVTEVVVSIYYLGTCTLLQRLRSIEKITCTCTCTAHVTTSVFWRRSNGMV